MTDPLNKEYYEPVTIKLETKEEFEAFFRIIDEVSLLSSNLGAAGERMLSDIKNNKTLHFQAARMSVWRDVKDSLPETETQVLAVRLATGEQLSTDKEYHPVIFAAIDPDREGVWYDWDNDKDIDTSYFEITHWMPVSDLV
jgi:hypothetical protein